MRTPPPVGRLPMQTVRSRDSRDVIMNDRDGAKRSITLTASNVRLGSLADRPYSTHCRHSLLTASCFNERSVWPLLLRIPT
jgi:hypothetical protein